MKLASAGFLDVVTLDHLPVHWLTEAHAIHAAWKPPTPVVRG
ncbi:hypothetical protein [Streptomyces sp. NPDC056690]